MTLIKERYCHNLEQWTLFKDNPALIKNNSCLIKEATLIKVRFP